jgi:pimeloyl-ACP methyl ester carboxylesterase
MIDIGPESLTTDWARDELPAMLAGLAGATYAQPQDAVTEWLAGNPLAREPLMRHYVEHCLTPGPGGALRWRFDGHGLARQVATGIAPQERLWQAVDRVRIPTLLVRGEHSPLVAPDAADRVTHRLADGHRAEIRHGGHDLGVEQPEAVTEAVTAFLGPTSGVAG